MPLHVEISYHTVGVNNQGIWDSRERGEWLATVVDEDERQAGDRTKHRLQSEALNEAKKYNMPIYIYTRSDQLHKIIKPPF